MNKLYGIIGYPVAQSFSPSYFKTKFEAENITDSAYKLFALPSIDDLLGIINDNPSLIGLNVTIPHKQAVMKYLDEISPDAMAIGAVNLIKIERGVGKMVLQGFNTDAHGFEASIKPLLMNHHRAAMILGTGGGAKAAAYVFSKLGMDYAFVSRAASGNKHLAYNELSIEHFRSYHIIVNATPVGMWPNHDTCPKIPYQNLSSQHLLFDLVYNPAETLFLQKGKQAGAMIKNGLEMLYLQADHAWKIWQEN